MSKVDITEGDGALQPLGSFEDALMTWDGDIVRLILPLGPDAGKLQMSHDGETAWLIGDVKTSYGARGVGTGYSLNNIEHERAYRTSAITGLEFLKGDN